MPTVLRSHPAYPPGIKPIEVARAPGEAERPEMWSRGALIVPASEVGGHPQGHGVGVGLGTLSGAAKWAAGRYGPVLDVTGASAAVEWPTSVAAMDEFRAGLEGIAVIAVWTHRGGPSSNYAHIFGRVSSGGAFVSSFSLKAHTTANAHKLRFGIYGGGAERVVSSITDMVVGRTYMLVGTWKASTRVALRIYDLDAGGRLHDFVESTLSSTPATLDADTTPLAMGGSGGRYANGQFHAGYILPRSVTNDEADRWAADPFAPLRPAPHRVVTASVAAGVSGAVLVAGGGTIAAAGTKTGAGGALVAGGGTQEALGTKVALGAASVSGGGSVAATGTVTIPNAVFGAVSITGGGALSSAGTKSGLGAVLIPGGGEVGTTATRTSSGAVYVLGGGNVATTGYGPLGPPQSVSTAVVLWRWDRLADSIGLGALVRALNQRFVRLQQILDGVRREDRALFVTPNLRLGTSLTLEAQAQVPRAPPESRLVLYATKDGAGKMVLNVKYPGGATAVIHTEP